MSKPTVHEYKILTHVTSNDTALLQQLSGEGWDVVGFDWADHGTHGAVLLRRPVRN